MTKLLWTILIGTVPDSNYHFRWGTEKFFSQDHMEKFKVSTALIIKVELTKEHHFHMYSFLKKMWHFYWPSRGRTRQLKADTVALAKTWQGAPHTAAEMFPGENPAPNTCTSLPPRQPLKQNYKSVIIEANLFFHQVKSQIHAFMLPSFLLCPPESTQLALGS